MSMEHFKNILVTKKFSVNGALIDYRFMNDGTLQINGTPYTMYQIYQEN